MVSQSFAIGSDSATDLRGTSPNFEVVSGSLHTVKQLLEAIESAEPASKLPMLRSTAFHVSECANIPVNEMPIEILRTIGPEFAVFLKERRYARSSVTTFGYYLRKLIQHADILAASPSTQALWKAWSPVTDTLKEVTRAPKSVVEFAVSKGISPTKFSEADLNKWADWMKRRGRKHRTLRQSKWQFRAVIRRSGLEHLLPALFCQQHRPPYGISTKDMPVQLRTEVTELLKWKQVRFAKGRPQWTRHRPVSARELEVWIGRLYGYATRIAGYDGLVSLAELFTEEVVTSFVEWALNIRKISRASILRLTMIYGALRHNPKYKDGDYRWFTTLLDQLPEDDEAARLERKAAKFVSYEELCKVAAKLREKRLKVKNDPVHSAWLMHDELLMTWLTTLPFRQRNLRECRLGEPETANVFYAPLPQMTHIAKGKWVEEALAKNPDQCFWQFHFRPEETKTGHIARGILPRRLAAVLGEYLQHHRPVLVRGGDPSTLFLNRDGGALDRQVIADTVAQLVLEYAGRRMTPHLFRDAFALAWLDSHPEDYLTLSKILWHQSIKYTLKVYGRNFDESNGARRVDEWLEAR